MELTGKRFWILGLQLIVIVSILSCTTKKISSPVALGNIFTPAFFQTEEYLSVIDYLGKNLCLQDEMERYTYKICVKIDSLGFVKQATLIDVVQHSHNDSILLYTLLNMPQWQPAKENGKNIHFMGLTSNGGVHSSMVHLFKLCDISKEYGIDNTFIHCFFYSGIQAHSLRIFTYFFYILRIFSKNPALLHQFPVAVPVDIDRNYL